MADEVVGAPGGESAAPAEAVPSVAPAAAAAPASTGDGGASAAPSAAPRSSDGVEVKRTQIKPIPDRPRDRDGTFKGPTKDLHRHNLGFKPKSERDGSPERMLPGKVRAPAAPIEAKPGDQAPSLVEMVSNWASLGEPDPTPAPFKFAGREWRSQEQAENSLRTLQGQYKPLIAEKDAEAQKAFGWYQHSLALQEKLKQYESGALKPGQGAGANSADQTAAAPAPNSDPNDPFAGIDMGVYQLLAQNDGPQVAAAWLQGEVAKNQGTRIQAQIEAAVAPFKEAQQQATETRRLTGQVDNLYQWATSQRNEDGSPVFAELGDPVAERETGEIVGWLCSQGVPEEMALSPLGLKIASLLRKDAYSLAGSPVASSNAPNQAAAAVAASLLQGQPAQDPVSGPSSRTTQPGAPKTREDQVKSDMRNARLRDPDLGFIRRSAPI